MEPTIVNGSTVFDWSAFFDLREQKTSLQLSPDKVALVYFVDELETWLLQSAGGIPANVHAALVSTLCTMLGVDEQDEPTAPSSFAEVTTFVRNVCVAHAAPVLDRWLKRLRSVAVEGDCRPVRYGNLAFRRGELPIGILSYRSPLGRFLREAALALDIQHEGMGQLRKWIEIDANLNQIATADELGTFPKARRWLDRQLHLAQLCPAEAAEPEVSDVYCRAIQQRYRLLTHVHLLVTLNRIRDRDFQSALTSLHLFFETSTIRVNTAPSVSPVSLDPRVVRFAPLLQARLCRIFEQRDMCASLIDEAVQQAHVHRDWVALRLALIEHALLEMDGHTVARQKGGPQVATIASLMAHEDGEDLGGSKELQHSDGGDHAWVRVDATPSVVALGEHLTCASRVVSALALASKATDFGRADDDLQRAVWNAWQPSSGGTVRQLSNAARAARIALSLVGGRFEEVVSANQAMEAENQGDGVASRHDTHAHAVAGTSAAYALSAQGRHDKAEEMVEALKRRFPTTLNFEAGKLCLMAETVVRSMRQICEGQLDDQLTDNLRDMSVFDRDEALLRAYLVRALRGDLQGALKKLETLVARLEKRPQKTLVLLRARIQEASVRTALRENRRAGLILVQVREEAAKRGLPALAAMADRRRALATAEENLALKRLNDCDWQVNNVCTRFEVALLHLTRCDILVRRMEGGIATDPDRERLLEEAAMATEAAREAGAPILEVPALEIAEEQLKMLKREQEAKVIHEKVHRIKARMTGGTATTRAVEWRIF